MTSRYLGTRNRQTRRRARRGAVLVLVLAAIVLLAATVTLIARRAILSRKATDSAATVAQAESVWVTAAEIVRHTGAKSDLQFSLPPRGHQSRAAIAQVRDDEQETWEIEVRIEQEGRVIARRRGRISVPQQGESQ